MKVSSLLPLVLSTSALAASGRRSHNALAARQAQMKRGLVDVCVALDLDVDLLDILPGGKPLIAGHLDLCLCLSVLPDFCKSNSVAQNVIGHLGSEEKALDFFHDLINNQTGKQHCTYPEHAVPFCDVKNPCGWHCKDGFQPDDPKNPTKCICPPPSSECNGVCGNFPHGCSSQAASHKKRTATCSSGMTPCGVAGGSQGKGYECVDTKSNLESCGGCMVASPFDASTVIGKDCSTIPNVSAVQCRAGSCAVSKCADGFKISAAGDACDLVSQVTSSVKRDADAAQLTQFVQSLLNLHILTGVTVLDDVWAIIGVVAHFDSVDALLNALIAQGLVADVAGLLGIKEGLLAGIHIGRRDVDAAQLTQFVQSLLDLHLLAGVTVLDDVWAIIGVVAHFDSVDALLNACLAQGLIANVADILAIKQGLLAGIHIGRRDVDAAQLTQFVQSLLDLHLLAGVTALDQVWAVIGAVAHFDSVDALLNALIAQGLVADVAGILGIKEGLLAGIHIGRRDVDAAQLTQFVQSLLDLHLLAGVTALDQVWAVIGAVAHFDSVDALLNALIAQGLVANVTGLLGVKEGLLAGIHIGRRDVDAAQLTQFVQNLLNLHLLAGVAVLDDVWAIIGVVAHFDSVDAILNACLAQGLIANVADLAAIKQGLLAGVHIGRGEHLVDLGILQGLGVVSPIADAVEGLGVSGSVL